MELLGYKIFPKKVYVTITMTSGTKHFMACDEFDFDSDKGFTFKNAVTKGKFIAPGKTCHINLKSIETINARVKNIFAIYKV